MVKLEEPIVEIDSAAVTSNNVPVVTKRRRGRPKKVVETVVIVDELDVNETAATSAKRKRVLKETNNNQFATFGDDEDCVEIVGQSEWRTVRRKIEKTPTEGDFPKRMTRSNSKLTSDAQ